ncbi:MAG: hypothetical protein DHS80DRAFT_22089 [Piptocephalis tieghemiana]|nr:MAG: hypothetical protein DHS80DRAFT_22089 [Piptocephalis tieghemiana]
MVRSAISSSLGYFYPFRLKGSFTFSLSSFPLLLLSLLLLSSFPVSVVGQSGNPPSPRPPSSGSSALPEGAFNLQTYINSFKLRNATGTENAPKSCQYLSTPQVGDGPTTWDCPAGSFCLQPNSIEPCPPGFFCPANTAQPLYCCPGYYCPTPGVLKPCSENHFCPAGSVSEFGCHFLARCPPYTATSSKFGIAVLFLGLILVICILFAIKARSDGIRRAKYRHLLLYGYNKEDERAKVDMGRAERTFDISFENLGLVLPTGVEIMRGVSGELSQSRACAILGPSGAGKTTFVNLLTGKAKKTSGTVRINGVEGSLNRYRKLIGFVPQEDIMLRELTVRDILMHSALMRLPSNLPRQVKASKVLETIKYLELGHIMDNVIGNEEERGISGGQRKRVNIGMELVANPSILFLDEPTSGLDSATSLEVCTLLRNIAHLQGLTIAAVIHSPSPQAFNQFDDLLVLGKGGRTVYFGPRDKAPAYFASIGFPVPADENPADFYLAVTSNKVKSKLNSSFVPNDLFRYWEEAQQGPYHGKSIGSSDPAAPHAIAMLSTQSSSTDPSHGPMTSTGIHHKEGPLSSVSGMNWGDEEVKQGKKEGIGAIPGHMWTAVTTGITEVGMYIADVFNELGRWFLGLLLFWKRDPIRHTPSGFTVFWLCLKRSFTQIFRSRSQFLWDQLLHLGCGAFISIAARNFDYLGRQPDAVCNIAPIALLGICQTPIDHIAEVGVFLSMGVCYSGISVGSQTFGNEKVVYWRDSASGMSTIPYFLAKVVADLPRAFIAALCFTLSFVIFFSYRSAFIYIFGITYLLYISSFAMGYFVSALVKRETVGLVGTALALAWAIVFSGVVPDLDDVMNDDTYSGARWLWSLSAPRWAIEALFLKEVEARPFYEIREDKLPHAYDDKNYYPDLVYMAAIAIAWDVIAFFALKLVHRSKMK